MRSGEKVRDSLVRLEKYILEENFRGYDPFDGLMSPIFKLPLLKSNKFSRLSFQQVFRRLPLNLRSLFSIKKSYNPVTLGLCIQSLTYLCYIYPEKKDFYHEKIDFLINELINLESKGFSGTCWGYDFDWEARYAKIPAFTPTIVATGFITNALFVNYQLTENKKAFELCESAVDFVTKDLNKSYESDTFCYSYSPFDKQRVYNASMKGARLLAQTGYYEEARKTVEYVINNQNVNGSWGYSKGDSRDWIDNFHTGYILDCLDEYMILSGDNSFKGNLEKGVLYYINNFFCQNSVPKYYNNKIYPVDCTAAGQAILTLLRFGYTDLASNVVKWMIDNMQNEKGYFYYQKHKYWKNKISYMRWSNAWMFLALSRYLYEEYLQNL